MFPLRDVIPSRTTPFVTVAIIIVNVLAFLFEQSLGPRGLEEFIQTHAFIPANFAWSTIFTSMFLHGSWFHLLGNMWFLRVFGDNIEDSMGHLRYLVFYLACGVAAALLQVFVNPASVIPMVGASGAISGVMGAYLVLYPRVRVFAIVPIGIIPLSIALPAWTMLLYWMGMQFLGGLFGLFSEEGGGVAFWAHIGGFVAGVVLVKFFARGDYVRQHRSQHWQPRRVSARW